jgi:hypothetical protein
MNGYKIFSVLIRLESLKGLLSVPAALVGKLVAHSVRISDQSWLGTISGCERETWAGKLCLNTVTMWMLLCMGLYHNELVKPNEWAWNCSQICILCSWSRAILEKLILHLRLCKLAVLIFKRVSYYGSSELVIQRRFDPKKVPKFLIY